jgi:hypothetical protein
MYFNGNLSIDPAQLTKIEKVKPQKAFKRILYFLTVGAISDKVEQETFSAVSILQQLYTVFNSIGINNLVRLSHDDIDFYLDAEGKKDDLKATLDLYDLQTNEAMSESFKQLSMVLEHEENGFKYLINITINRTHHVGVYPIDIFIDGLLDEFAVHNEAEANALKTKMEKVFKDQESYNSFIMERQNNFDQFLDKIKYQINKIIRVTDVKRQSKTNILIPKESKKDLNSFRNQNPANYQAHSPVYHGYYGFGDFFFYSYLWSSMCHTNHIHIHDTSLVSEEGSVIRDIDHEGVDAGDNSLFDSDQDYNSRLSDNDLYYDEESGSYGEGDSGNGDSWWGGSDSGNGNNDSSDSWWGGDDSGSSDSGDSSCSSCSSCGGCGGGD